MCKPQPETEVKLNSSKSPGPHPDARYLEVLVCINCSSRFHFEIQPKQFLLALTCWPPEKRHSSCVLLYVKLLLSVISTFLDLNHSFGQH